MLVNLLDDAKTHYKGLLVSMEKAKSRGLICLPANQLIWREYPIIYKVLAPSQAVVWDFWTINSTGVITKTNPNNALFRANPSKSFKIIIHLQSFDPWNMATSMTPLTINSRILKKWGGAIPLIFP